MPRVYDTTFREMFSKGLVALLPCLLPNVTSCQAKSLLTLLAARGIKVSSAMRTKILACTDAAALDRWLKNALHAASVAEVIGAQ